MPRMTQTNLRIDGKRLWDSLMGFAEIGATAKGGVRRLTLTDVDKRARDRFRTECEALGLTVRVDAIGNMFARRAGRDPSRAPVLFGSHLDSQPSGGKFDGALGVLAGLEVMRSLNDLDVVTEAPLELINWTDEEGSRFGHSLMGSGVWAGVFGLEKAYGLTDTEGVSVASALDGIGYRGAEPAAPFQADAYFELHIEQGPFLEREGRQIGIVTGAQGQVWYDAVVTGQDSHAGTTPPSARRDALVGAARIVDLVDRIMRARGEDGRGTVGQIAGVAQQPECGAGGGAVLGRVPASAGCGGGCAGCRVPAGGAGDCRCVRGAAGADEVVQDPGSAVRSRGVSIWCGRGPRGWATARGRSFLARRMTRCMWRGMCRRR